jgi:hypothetical protein
MPRCGTHLRANRASSWSALIATSLAGWRHHRIIHHASQLTVRVGLP